MLYFYVLTTLTAITTFPSPTMEFVPSNSPPPNGHRPHSRFKPTQSFADRIVRALRHRLLLLHRAESNFYVLGATGNVYTVTLSTTTSCTCPDRAVPCKHILFVFLRVLGISLDDTCLRRRFLRPCQVNRLLGMPTSVETLAGTRVQERFHQLFSKIATGPAECPIELEDGAMCPICMDEMKREQKVVACGACSNAVHEECLQTWKRTRGRRSASCVICRARWRDKKEQEKYLNLAAYVSEDDMVDGEGVYID